MITSPHALARLFFLVAFQFSPSFTFSQSYPVKVERTFLFDSLSIHVERLSLDIRKGALTLIECEKGVTGVVILTGGSYSFATDGPQSIRDDFAVAMLRFNPSDYHVFIRPTNARPDSQVQILDRSRKLVERDFHFLYHSGDNALIPGEGILAAVLSGRVIGDVIVHQGGETPPLVYSITEKRALFEGKKSPPKPFIQTVPDTQETVAEHINRRYNKDLLLKDLDFVVSKLSAKEFQRDPFAYVDKNYFYRVVDSAHTVLASADSMSLGQFFILAGRIISLVRDDHATIGLGGRWVRPGLEGKPFPDRILLPLSVVIKDSACLVIGASAIPLRARLLSVNGVPITKVIGTILGICSSSEFSALRNGLQVFFDFPRHALELYALQGLRDSALVRFLPPGESAVVERYVALLPYYDRLLFAESFRAVSVQRKPPRQFRIIDNTAVIGVNGLRLSNNPESELKAWLSFFDSTFQSIAAAKIPNVLIDMSENGGGAERVGYILLNYLWRGKLKTTYYSEEFTLDSLVRTSVLSQMKDVSYADYKWTRFEGKVYLLIGERTFSSAARLADIFKTNRMGTIIGRPTRAFRSHYGEMASGQLPNTGLSFTWSTKFFVSASGDVEPHGISPDVTIALEGPEDPINALADELLVKRALEIIRQREH